MENSNKSVLFIIIAVIALIVGAVGGYYYGNSRGIEEGKVLGRQEVEAETLAEVQRAANPFSDIEEAVNPFKDSYQNPFSQ